MFTVLKALHISFPIHVCCMFAGILIRLFFDAKKGADHTALYEASIPLGTSPWVCSCPCPSFP